MVKKKNRKWVGNRLVSLDTGETLAVVQKVEDLGYSYILNGHVSYPYSSLPLAKGLCEDKIDGRLR